MPPNYPCETVWPPMPLSYFTTIMGIILTTLIVVGNFLICLAVVKDPLKTLRTPFMYFIVNAAVSDFLVGIVAMPTTTYMHILEIKSKLEFSNTANIGHITFFALSSASIFSVATLSLERYMCVVHPFVYRQKLNFKRCFCVSTLIWTLSIGLAMLYVKVGHRIYFMIYAHYSVAMIIGVLIFTYVRIYQRLYISVATLIRMTQIHKSTQWNQNTHQVRDSSRCHRNLKRPPVYSHQIKAVSKLRAFTRLLLSILIVYTILYLPVLVLAYIGEFCLDWNCDLRHILRDFVHILLAATSAVNPFMCTLRLRPFREAIKIVFHL